MHPVTSGDREGDLLIVRHWRARKVLPSATNGSVGSGSGATSAHQREVFSVKGWAGARVLVVGPCIAVIEVCSAACDRVVSTTGRGGL